jgi:GNAT superfamily N-acetyltransferase
VEQVWGWDEEEQRALHDRRFSSQDFRVIQVSGMDVGILALVREPECMRVNQMFILPEHQNKGVGTACMRRIMGDAARLGVPVRLQVLKVNARAAAFYERLGFCRISERENHVAMEWTPSEPGAMERIPRRLD